MDEAKSKLIDLFEKNVKGKKPDTSGKNLRHDGKKGHWLEQQFGITANGNNGADLYGYELKDETTSKTTFGDWSANWYIFKDVGYFDLFGDSSGRQNNFCKIFGKQNIEKGGRYAWSGACCPKIENYNSFGQKLVVESNSDVSVVYSYSKDLRENKNTIIPPNLQKDQLIIANWFGKALPPNTKGKTLKSKFDDKFNKKGWFTCKTDSCGVYDKICFGKPMVFENWIEDVKKGIVFFDSGMYEGNKRPYSQWRASNGYWNNLITEIY